MSESATRTPSQTIEVRQRTLLRLEKENQKLKESMEERRESINELNKAQEIDQAAHRTLVFRIAEITNRIFACTPLPEKLLDARSALLKKIERSHSDKIAVGRQKTLRTEIDADLSALQGICTHPFVFSYDGYRGSQSYDWDDQRHGHRICTLCNLRETSKGTDKDIYAILNEDTTRLVRRDLRNEKEHPKYPEQEWFPVSLLQQLFEDSARGINVQWPEQPLESEV